jgi:hypothetical protein
MQKFQTYQFKTHNFKKEVQIHTRRNPQCLKKFALLESIIKKSLNKIYKIYSPLPNFPMETSFEAMKKWWITQISRESSKLQNN